MTDKNTIANNINSLFGSITTSTLHPGVKNIIADSINNKKSGTSVIENKNAPYKSYSYQEDKNLKYRQAMEDIGVMYPDLTTDYRVSLFGIFDGHGGTDVVKFVKDRLPQLIKNYLMELIPVEKAFEKAFNKIDEELKFYDSEYIGCTATIVLIQNNKIYCANVGDSKAFILEEGGAKQISTDHKCTDPDEQKRILEKGGKIIKNRFLGQLILSRTLGDLHAKKYGITPSPSVSVSDISKSTKYIILASDGVWDVLSNDDIIKLSEDGKPVGDFCKDVVKASLDKGSRDNISCIIVSFKN